MEQLLIYAGKLSLATMLFYLAYRLLFRSRKQYRFNRFYLLGSMASGFIIPLITLTLTRADFPQMVILGGESASAVTVSGTSGHGSLTLTEFLFYLYLAGAVFFLIRLVAGHLKAWELIRHCRNLGVNGTSLLISETAIHPFTFFNKVVIGRETLDHPGLPMILEHENVHAREKHTVDILLSELMFLFQWFNPFAWLHKEAIKNNLEFLADQEVISHSDMKDYQLALVSLADKKGVTPFLTALNGTDLKNRIIMMKKKTGYKSTGIRRIALLPLLAMLILGLSNKEFKAAPGILPEIPNFEGFLQPDQSGDSVKEFNTQVQVTAKSMTIDGQQFTGDSITVRTVHEKPGNQPLYIIDGNPVESVKGIDPESIESISVLKDKAATAVYGEKGKNGVILITTKNGASEKSESQSSAAVKKERVEHFIKITDSKDLLIIIDGKESTRKVADIDPEGIQSVTVLKGEAATGKYGEKGKNGVIEIIMKEMSTSDKKSQPSTGAASSGEVRITGFSTGNGEKITSVGQMRSSIARTIKYPVKAQEMGLQSEETVYGYVSDAGKIIRITDRKPDGEVFPVEEVIIVAYAKSGTQKAATLPSKAGAKSTLLNDEASLAVRNLPDIDIPEYKGRWLKFQFKFVLQ